MGIELGDNVFYLIHIHSLRVKDWLGLNNPPILLNQA